MKRARWDSKEDNHNKERIRKYDKYAKSNLEKLLVPLVTIFRIILCSRNFQICSINNKTFIHIPVYDLEIKYFITIRNNIIKILLQNMNYIQESDSNFELGMFQSHKNSPKWLEISAETIICNYFKSTVYMTRKHLRISAALELL